MKSSMCCFVPFLAVFYAVGFGLLGSALWSARRSTQAAAWPTVPATITKLELSEHSDSEGSSYVVEVQYTYAVDGTTYEGSRVAFGYGDSSGRASHEEIYQKLKTARAVAARYNPSDPSESCLSFGIHRSIQLTFAFATTWLMFVIGFSLLVWLFSRRDGVLVDNLTLQ